MAKTGLISIFPGHPHRPTRDLDLLGQGVSEPVRFQGILHAICRQNMEHVGLEFQADSVHAERMEEDDEHQGLRLKLQAILVSARNPMQSDIGFGDAITPGPD